MVVGAGLLILGRRHRRLGYLLDWLGLASLCFGVVLALAELFGLDASVVTTGASVVYLWRMMSRLIGSTRRPIPELPEPEPVSVVFRDDGQVLTFYPSRRKLAAHGVFAAAIVLIFTALAVIFHGVGVFLILCLGVFALLGLYGLIPDLTRLVHRWPALIVTSEGITDRASAGAFGFGLIPWREIVAVFDAGNMRGSRFRELAILPVSFQRLLARQPAIKRPLLRFASTMGGGAIFIWSLYLSQPPAEISHQIHDYVKQHAPIGYLEADGPEGEGESEVGDQADDTTRRE